MWVCSRIACSTRDLPINCRSSCARETASGLSLSRSRPHPQSLRCSRTIRVTRAFRFAVRVEPDGVFGQCGCVRNRHGATNLESCGQLDNERHCLRVLEDVTIDDSTVRSIPAHVSPTERQGRWRRSAPSFALSVVFRANRARIHGAAGTEASAAAAGPGGAASVASLRR
jgi:hypothetical protein